MSAAGPDDSGGAGLLDAAPPHGRPNFVISARYFATTGAGGEFMQAGIEFFGDVIPNRRYEVLGPGLAAAAHYGLAATEDHLGDVGFFFRFDRRARTRAGLETAVTQGF